MGDESTTSAPDVVVVGAGLVGMATACALARRGARVTVLERAIAGAAATRASSAAAGILGPQLEHDDDGPTLALGLEGARATARLLDALVREGLLDAAHDGVDHVTTPAMKVAFDEPSAAALARRVAWQRAKGLRAELLDGDAARARAPALSRDVVAAALFPDDHALDPKKYQALLRALALRRGVTVREGALAALEVDRVTKRARGVRLDDDAALAAEHVVLCAGAWSAMAPGVRELIGLTLDDVHPVKGQVVELAPSPGDAPAVDRVIYGACYLVPRRDGRVVCGATMERAGFDTEVTPRATADLVAAARRTVPALADAPVASSWVGLRPATRDGLPLIGESRVRGLWLGTGHFRNGVLLAALTAELLGALVAGAADDVGALAGALGPPGLLPFAPERLG